MTASFIFILLLVIAFCIFTSTFLVWFIKNKDKLYLYFLKETSDKANITFVICLFSVIILPVLLQFFIRKEIVIAIVVIGFILNYIIYIKKFNNSGKKLIDLNEKIIWNILADYFGKDNIEKTESFKIKNVQGDVIHRIGYKEFELYKNTYIYSKHYHESTLAKLYINLEGEATYRLKSIYILL